MQIFKDKLLERITNLAVIAVAVVFIFAFLRHDFSAHQMPDSSFHAKSVSMSSITATPARMNLVLGISTVCRFCEQNIGFYQKLSTLEKPGALAFYTVFPQSASEAQAFLKQKDIHPTGVVSSSLATYKINGTPTLLLVNSSGKVVDFWVGALDSAKQAAVIHKIEQVD